MAGVWVLVVALMMVACVPTAAAPTDTAPLDGSPGPAATAPAPPTATTPVTVASSRPPVISSFAASTTAAPSPLTTALVWSISDPDGSPLTCRLNLDNDAAYEAVVSPCTSAHSRTRTFTGAGVRPVTLQVTDGVHAVIASLTLTIAVPSADQFSITLRIAPGMSASQTLAFTSAKAKWESIIRTGVPDQPPVSLPANYCSPTSNTPAYTGGIDDIFIEAQIAPIDGPGGTVGQAGPCWFRPESGLPIYGVMRFDIADVARLEAGGLLTSTILHEMGHALGVGQAWSSALLKDPGTTNPTFTGPAAVGRWSELGGTGNVPVENTGGPGTANMHWRDGIFGTELMTGYISAGNQLSALTAASLADLGYGVNLAAADSYTPASLRSLMEAFSLDPARQRDGTEIHDGIEGVTRRGAP